MKKYVLSIGEKDYSAEVIGMTDDTARISVDGNIYDVTIKEFGLKREKNTIAPAPVRSSSGEAGNFSAFKPAEQSYQGGSDGVRAPMPGVITGIHVKPGERIKAGELVLVIEAMKMENEIKSPYDGIVGKIHILENDSVSEGDILVELKRPAMTTL
jgi:biotin carboxyl carrier protein